jgi:uncharacterized protein YuzE
MEMNNNIGNVIGIEDINAEANVHSIWDVFSYISIRNKTVLLFLTILVSF